MAKIDACLMSKRADWRTPKKLYAWLDKQFEFDFDPCPVDPDFDGLSIPWGKCNFVNPPYGREIGKWVARAFTQWHGDEKVSVLLVPARTDTRWWHDYVSEAAEIWFIKGRLKFDDGKNPAPFPSAIVVFKEYKEQEVKHILQGWK